MKLQQIRLQEGDHITERVTQGNLSFGFLLRRGEAMKDILVRYTGDAEPTYWEIVR